MSADNWATCPKCRDQAKAKRQDAIDDASESYGTVSLDEYERLRDAALALPSDEDGFQTFREDYEFYGATDGTVRADYSGHCAVCGLGVDFSHEHPFYEAL